MIDSILQAPQLRAVASCVGEIARATLLLRLGTVRTLAGNSALL